MTKIIRPTKLNLRVWILENFPQVEFDTITLKREKDHYEVEVFNGLDKIGKYEGWWNRSFYETMKTHFKWQFGE